MFNSYFDITRGYMLGAIPIFSVFVGDLNEKKIPLNQQGQIA